MLAVPIEIKRTNKCLSIKWNDGLLTEIDCQILRKNCPCASCLEKYGLLNHAKPIGGSKKANLLNIISSSIEEETALEKIWSVGNYALGVRWKDGHDTGIYSFSLLRDLASKAD